MSGEIAPYGGAGGRMIRVRALVASGNFDIVLAVIGLAITQVQLVRQPGGWPDAALPVQVFLAAAPALLAIRRVDPVLASAGLVIGAYLSVLVNRGDFDYVLLIGGALALWSLASRCRVRTVLVAGAVITAVPVVARVRWGVFESALFPSIYRQVANDPLWDAAASGGPSLEDYNRAMASRWPWWLSVVLFAVCLLSLLYRRLRRTAVVERTVWERIEDLRTFLLTTAALDAVLAMVTTSLMLADLGRDIARGNWWSAPGWMPYVIAFSALTLVQRRKWPAVPVVVLAIGALLAYWQTSTSWSVLVALSIALFTMASVRRVRYSMPVAAVVLTALPVIAAFVRYPQMVLIFPALEHQPQTFGDMHNPPDNRIHNVVYEGIVDRQWPITLSLILVLPLCAGVLARLYRRNRSAAAREAELEQRAVEQDAAQVVLTERSHIARDLHDVVAHAVNLMVIQAETGPDLLKRGDDDALAGFQRIGDAGRRALGELDRMLSALRDAEGVPDPALTPQPGLADLGQLVKSLSDQGLPVELEVRGETDGVPAGIQLTAYRLVQEAMTNVAKHAKARSARILVERNEAGVAVRVIDDGQGFDPGRRPDGRHGLTGMQERVRIHDGTLSISSSPGSGTTVSAWLPVGAR
ncbi:sensor histidine kinase [Kribbella voronezhensis]|nr:sensor histidine kinase [Kribbella voronezhensis]